MLAWLTPDSSVADGVIHCRLLAIPTEYLPMVNGALGYLGEVWNWEQQGDITPDTAALAMQALIEGYYMSDGCRVGTIFPYISQAAPDGSLPLDGSTFDDDDYPLLAAALDATFDNGDGTFTLPDLRGRSILGAGAGAGLSVRSVGDVGGAEVHQLTVTEMPSHNHSYLPPAINPDVEGPGIPDIGATIIGPLTSTGSNGGDGSHNNMHPFVALNHAVWYR